MIQYFKTCALGLALVLVGCGGGGSGSVSSTGGASEQSSGNFAIGLPVRSSVASNIAIAQPAPNVAPITAGTGNKLLVSVTVCQPGTTVCTTVDKVMLDTGSVGLRLHASVFSALPGLLDKLPADRVGSAQVGECAVFGNFYTWGTLRVADVTIAAVHAPALKLQVYDDPGLESASASGCDTRYGGLANPTPGRFQFNGILGVKGSSVDNQRYFGCNAGTCSALTQGIADQLPNPVPRLASDNNGVLIQMPGLLAAGAASAQGALVLGINTRPNNILAADSSAPSIILLDSQLGFQLSANGNASEALIDSGTSVYSLPGLDQQGVPTCRDSLPTSYCPASELSLPIQAKASSQAAVVVGATLHIGNAAALVASGNVAFDNVATTVPSTLSSFSVGALLGAPFFYGRNIYFSMDGQAVVVGGATFRQAFVAF